MGFLKTSISSILTMLKSVQIRVFLTPAGPPKKYKSGFFKIVAACRSLQQGKRLIVQCSPTAGPYPKWHTLIFQKNGRPQGLTKRANFYLSICLPPPGPHKKGKQRIFKLFATRRALQNLKSYFFKISATRSF